MGKAFGGVPVLQDVSFAVARGEVHALLGENGAGKSTLMNVLAGIYAADTGSIRIEGAEVRIRSPKDASALGIGMVHQHFRLVPAFTAAENLLLASGGRHGIETLRAATARLNDLGQRTGLVVEPGVPVRDLGIADRQRIEILKVLALGARLLVLDEPTAVLTDHEATRLLDVVRGLAGQGIAVVLITHKLREVVAGADRVTVMRKGRITVAGIPAPGLDAAALAGAMVEEAPPAVRPGTRVAGKPRLEVEDLRVRRADGSLAVDDVAFTVRAGEILGVAGVGGNGQQECAEALIGLVAAEHGAVRLDGRDIASASVRERRRLGLRYVPSDRARTGLLSALDVTTNLALTAVPAGSHGNILLDRAAMRSAAVQAIDAFAIAGAHPSREVGLLSGGNAQKLVLARELDRGVAVLVAHSPTRGLDVGAAATVHDLLRRTACDGAAILLVSEDLEEILALADRVVVMSRGRIVGERGREPPRAELGALMLGHA